MSNYDHPTQLFERYAGNPILTARDWPYPINTCFNPGAVKLSNGQTLLLVRVEDRRGISHLTAARSADGLTDWSIDSEPTFEGDASSYPEESYGVEDARVIHVAELERFVVLYTSYSDAGPGVSIATTADFKSYERLGFILPPDNKDAAIFPRRIGGRFAMIHRPQPASRSGQGDMWICFSPDLRHWGDHRELLHARRGAWWDANKIGLSTPPIETKDGWLVFYHGAKATVGGCLYRMGAVLLDLDDPMRVIARSRDWMFSPQREYERFGDVGDVVFPCGVTVDDETGSVRIYYGAADSTVAVASASIEAILNELRSNCL